MSLLLPSELVKLSASGGKNHAEAMKVLEKEFSDWPKGDLADTVSSVSPSMSSDQKKVWKRYQELTKKASSVWKVGDQVKTGYAVAGYPILDGSGRGGIMLPKGATGTVSWATTKANLVQATLSHGGIRFHPLWVPTDSLVSAKTASQESTMLLPSEQARLRSAKFPAGVSMTIDEVAEVVGDSFKEMNENPPPEVVALREEMMDKSAARPMPKADLSLIIKGRFPNARVTLSGLHGDGAEDISSFLRAAGFDGEFKVSSAEEAQAYMLKMLGVFKKHPEFEVGLGVDDLDLPELKIKWAGGSKTAAISDDDLFEAVKSAKKVGQKIRNVKDSAWKQAIRMGYIKLNGMMFEATPIGDVFFESMANRPGHTRWARFTEGPEGEKEFDAWIKTMAQTVQDDWKKHTEENKDKFKTAARFPPETDDGWDRLGYELLEQNDDMQQYWWKKGELYFVNLDAYEEDIYEYNEEIDRVTAQQIANKGMGKREEGFQKMGGFTPRFLDAAAKKPDLVKIKAIDGVLSAKMSGGKLVVVVANHVGNSVGKQINEKIAEMLADGDEWNFGDDSSFYPNQDDIPKGKKNQFTYTLKKTARFEEGQPADPTKEMSPEDAKKWEGNTDKYKDKFTGEEAMMDKFQDQLLPSESYTLMASTRFRSSWPKKAEDDIAGGIGATMKGPVNQNKDEKFMTGQFTQIENSELSTKVAGTKIHGTLEWLE